MQTYREAKAEPNLTPILDMVFQLITFFMLVVNFKGAAMDLSLQLPVLGSARPVENEGQEGLLVLNIDKDGQLTAYNKVQPDVRGYVAAQSEPAVERMQKENPNFRMGDELPTTVVIRADKGTQFNKLNEVITAAQEMGFRKFALKAMNKAEGT